MEIILLKDYENLGEKHHIVEVKNGFARNFLIPQGIAIIANSKNRNILTELEKQETQRENKILSDVNEIVESLAGKVLKIGAKAGTSGKIFGSVTNVQIAQALKEQLNIEVERRKIIIGDEVKTLGSYTATLDLHSEIDAKVQFEVVEE